MVKTGLVEAIDSSVSLGERFATFRGNVTLPDNVLLRDPFGGVTDWYQSTGYRELGAEVLTGLAILIDVAALGELCLAALAALVLTLLQLLLEQNSF
ncbi:hypothetical protein Tco_0384867 [Tanacetum coccineum]